MDIDRTLEDAGLTKNEVIIYLILVKNDELLASDISKKSGLARPYTYDLLNDLQNKGLTTFVQKNGKRYFRATPPEAILHFIKERQKQISAHEKRVLEILPLLIPAKSRSQKTSIEIYDSTASIRILYKSMLHQTKSLQALGATGTVLTIFPEFEAQRIRKKVRVQRLIHGFTGQKKRPYIETRLLPEGSFAAAPTLIYNDKIIIHIWSEPLAIVIQNKEIADQYKAYFNLLWKSAKKAPI
jgi:sugar-specific transcriptional regulator TrmB